MDVYTDYSGSGAGGSTEPVFLFEDYTPIFENNFMINNGFGYDDLYVWPYNVVQFGSGSVENTSSSDEILPPIINFPPNYSTDRPSFIILVVDDLIFTTSWNLSAPNGASLDGKTVKYYDAYTPNIQSFIHQGIVFPRVFVVDLTYLYICTLACLIHWLCFCLLFLLLNLI